MHISTRSALAITVGAALMLTTAAELTAQGRGGGRGGGGRGGAPMTATAYRQGIMQGFAQNTQALTAIRNGDVGAPGNMLGRAIILQQLALALDDAFPEGSIGEGSRALPAIWENPTELAARIDAIQAGADALVGAARGGDATAVGAAQQEFMGNCGACHTQFRGPPPPGF